MASITIKNIPDDLYDHLKHAASAHHRSVNSELIYCLEKALMPTRFTAEDLKEAAKLLRAKVRAENISVQERCGSADRLGFPLGRPLVVAK